MNEQETISIIITTKNESKNIKNCLESIKNQNYPEEKIEIIVVDNNSEDKTKEIAKEYTSQVFNKGPERSSQRNYGAEKAQGEYVMFIDADMKISPNLLEECEKIITKNKNIGGLFIPEIVSGDTYWPKVRRFERNFYNGTCIDATRLIKKNLFFEAGKYDERLYACEDWDLDKRLKKLTGFAITKNVIYHNEKNFCQEEYLAKKKYYIKNMHIYKNKWGDKDSDLKKQFGVWYRFIWVFIENKKWKKLLTHPFLSIGMYLLRFKVGINYLLRSKNHNSF